MFWFFFQKKKNCAKENTKTQVFNQFFVSWKSNNKESKHNERTHEERTNREEVKRKSKENQSITFKKSFFFEQKQRD